MPKLASIQDVEWSSSSETFEYDSEEAELKLAPRQERLIRLTDAFCDDSARADGQGSSDTQASPRLGDLVATPPPQHRKLLNKLLGNCELPTGTATVHLPPVAAPPAQTEASHSRQAAAANVASSSPSQDESYEIGMIRLSRAMHAGRQALTTETLDDILLNFGGRGCLHLIKLGEENLRQRLAQRGVSSHEARLWSCLLLAVIGHADSAVELDIERGGNNMSYRPTLGYELLNFQQINAAQKYFQALQKRAGSPPYSGESQLWCQEALFGQAHIDLRNNAARVAFAHLKEACQVVKDDHATYYRAGRMLQNANQLRYAAPLLNHAASLSPNNDIYLRAKSTLERNASLLTTAQCSAQLAAAVNEYDPDNHRCLAEVLYQKALDEQGDDIENFTGALNAFDKASKLSDGADRAHCLGMMATIEGRLASIEQVPRKKRHRWLKVVKHLRALEVTRNAQLSAPLAFMLVRTLSLLGRAGERAEASERIRLIVEACRRKNYRNELIVFLKQNDPDYIDVYGCLGSDSDIAKAFVHADLLDRCNLDDSAYHYYDQAVRLPVNGDATSAGAAHLLFAHFLERHGEKTRAVQHLKKAIKYDGTLLEHERVRQQIEEKLHSQSKRGFLRGWMCI